jgi:hypothetical protein
MTVVAWADKGFTFQGFTGDCTQSGETIMSAPRTCGAMFVKSGAPAPPPANRGSTTVARNTTANPGTVPVTTSPGTGTRSTANDAPATDPGGAPTPPKTVEERDAELVAPPKPPPPPPPAEVARKEIEELLERYRRAYEARNFEALQRAYPTVQGAIRDQFRQIRSLKLAFMGEPKFLQLDWFSGKALVELATQQTTEMSTGKRPPIDWIETIDIQKRGADNEWVIASVKRAQK